MPGFNDWPWVWPITALLICLGAGGLARRYRLSRPLLEIQRQQDSVSDVHELLTVAKAHEPSQIMQGSDNLMAPEKEYPETPRETELALLQLYQARQALDYYFKLSCDLKQQLERQQASRERIIFLEHELAQLREQYISPDLERRLRGIRERLLRLLRSHSHSGTGEQDCFYELLQHQQVLRRFQAPEKSTSPTSSMEYDELSFL